MTLVKPPRGTAKAARAAKKRRADANEHRAKAQAKVRDWFRCRRCGAAMLQGPLMVRIEAAHIRSKGMGGDVTGRVSWKRSDYVTLCAACHQGPRSVHSGHVVIEAGPQGGDGLVRFVDRDL